MPIVSKFLEDKLRKKKTLVKFFNDSGQTDRINATSITLTFLEDSNKMMTFVLPQGKIVNIEWVLGRIEKRRMMDLKLIESKNLFGDLLEIIKSDLDVAYLETIKSTQYGFSINMSNSKAHQSVIHELLRIFEKEDITHDIEQSLANTVTQYKILKTKPNLLKIKNYVKSRE